MSERINHWRDIRPALLIVLALAVVQIATGWITYQQSTNLVRESKFSAAANLANGLVAAISDALVVKDYAAIESRMQQTMANQEVAEIWLINPAGKVLTGLKREGHATKVVFNSAALDLPAASPDKGLAQTADERFITTWTKIDVGMGLGWIKLTTLVSLDEDELTSLRQQTLWLSMASLLSGALILGLFLWRAYFSLVKREHVIEQKLDDVSSRLHQSEKLASLGQLAAGVAHEINNPIGYVSSNLNTLQKYLAIYDKTIDQLKDAAASTPSPTTNTGTPALATMTVKHNAIRQDVQDLLRETHEGITRVKNIINDLKDFARSNAVQHFILADLHQGLRSTLNIVGSEVKARATIQLALGDLPEIECVPSQINQVFLNMVVNAAQAMPPGHPGQITIRSGTEGNLVWVAFEDNGSGMDAATIDRIFDPFFTTKDVGTGTGLGLSVSLGIVQRHHGQILVNSTPGVGTRFRIELPIRQTPANAQPQEHALDQHANP